MRDDFLLSISSLFPLSLSLPPSLFSPCFCDALAYGYLSVAAALPLATGKMADAVGACSNVTSYLARVKNWTAQSKREA